MTIRAIVEEYKELGRQVLHVESNEVADSSNQLAIVVEDKGRALMVDVGWEPEVGVHANIRTYVGGEYTEPDVFVLADSVLVTAR